ncbi:MAG: TonB-dependent receptor [Breznakibacter sp.]
MTMEHLVERLHHGNCSCVIARGDEVRTFTRRGVADLYDLLKHDPLFLQNAQIADKIIGKGAAALIVKGGMDRVYADVMSEPAFKLLTQAAIEVSYGRLVPHIINRDRTDWCPLEKSCRSSDSIEELMPVIDAFIAKMRGISAFWAFGVSLLGSSLWAQNTVLNDTLAIPEVVVTGTRQETDVRHLPMSVSVVDRTQIEKRYEPSLLPVLTEQVPGLFTTARGIMGYGVSTGASGGMSMRGVGGTPATGMLVLIDGHPQYMGLMGHPIADAYQSMLAKKVEVVRGPASVLYGSNAMGGVIHIITDQSNDDALKSHVRLGYGSFNTVTTEAGSRYRHKGFSSLVTGSYNRTDGHRKRMGFEQYGGYGKVGYDFSQTWKAFADVNLTHFNASNPGTILNPVYENDSRITRGMASASLENKYHSASGALKLFYNWGRHQINDGYAEGGTPRDYLFKSSDHMFGATLYQSASFFQGNWLTLGFDFKQFGGVARNDFFTGTSTTLGDRTEEEVAGYADWRQNIGQILTLNAGVRYDHHSRTGGQWVPQAGVSVCPLPSGEMKLMASRGFRNPTIRELYMFPPQNPDLKPESLWNYEISWSQRLWQGRFAYGVNLFLVKGDNMIQTIVQQGRPLNVNTGEIENRGAELSAACRLSKAVNLSGNYSLLHMETPVTGAPEQKIYLGVDYLQGRWTASTGLQHVEGLYTSTSPNTTETYTLWNLRGGFDLNDKIGLYLKLENLLDQTYEINSGFPMPGITVMGGISINF